MSGAIPPHPLETFMTRPEKILFYKYRCIEMSPKLSEFRSGKNMYRIKTYNTVILPAVFYGCYVWSRTLREGRRLRLFEIRC